MNDLQDTICDRLVGAAVGRRMADGPLHVACEVIEPGFKLGPRGDRKIQRRLAQTVGWPLAFCEAIHSANAALAEEGDRRSLAISIFSRVEPLRQPKLSAREQVSVAAEFWLLTHPWACPESDCPLMAEAAATIAEFRAGQEITREYGFRAECPSSDRQRAYRPGKSSSAGDYSAAASRFLREVLHDTAKQVGRVDATRHSARAAAMARGIDGAVEACLDLARRFKLTVSAV